MSDLLKISSRLPGVGTSIFTIMSRMAQEHGAINLSQGFPDFHIDEQLVDLVSKYMREGHNQYAPMPGVPALRQIIAELIYATYSRTVDAESEITITSGATEALYASIAAFVNTGDEVIMFDPCYDSYDPSVRLNGGVPVHINLYPPHFRIDWVEVEKRITARTKMILINTPHNPTGTVLLPEDLHALEKIISKHGLLVLSDEVYERIMFDGLVHQSVLCFPGLASRSIAVFSFGKTFHATGWKAGYAVAPEPLTKEIRKTHQFITFSVNTPVQMALAEYMRNAEHINALHDFFQKKRDYFLGLLKGSAFIPLPAHGSYFQLMSYKNISNLKEEEMAILLTKKYKVAAIPVSVFYKDRSDHNLLRFCFAKKEETLHAAAAILSEIRHMP